MTSEIPGRPLLFSKGRWKRSGFQEEGSGEALGLGGVEGRETGWDRLKTKKKKLFFFKKEKKEIP